MNAEELKVTVKMVDILHAPLMSAWERMCEKYGINEWCINEGLADDESTIEISLQDAEFYGLVNRMENTKNKTQCVIHDAMLSFISKYWDIKTGKDQIYGSPADIYGEIIEDGIKYWMRVDDGNCHNQLKDAVYHIYVSDIDCKII